MHRKNTTLVGAFVLTTSSLCATAYAQEEQPYAHLRAPSDSLELGVATGYTQGFGNLAPGRGIDNVAGAGIGFSGEIGYRFSRWLSLGAEGQYSQYESAENSSSKGANVNLGVTYHMMPVYHGDPWVRLGTGYRWIWEDNPNNAPLVTVERNGLQAVTLKAGYDFRLSQDVAIAPFVQGDVNVFVWEDTPNVGSGALNRAQVATFIYGGLQARFNLGGSRVPEPVAQRTPLETGVTAPMPQAPAPPPAPAPAPATEEEMKQVSPSVNVSEEILRQCMLHFDNVESAPKFDYNSSDLQTADTAVLQQIGTCFTRGPLKNARVQLVGRADPRGSNRYNDALGSRRANQVAEYLERMGIDPGRLEQTTRGKRDASGHDEPTWAVDRRVDLILTH